MPRGMAEEDVPDETWLRLRLTLPSSTDRLLHGPFPQTSTEASPCTCSFSFRVIVSHTRNRSSVKVVSSEIAAVSLHAALPWYTHLYTIPFLSLYPVLAYAYFVKYDDWLQSEEWTFLACVSLGLGHALSFLFTRWNTGVKAWITTTKVSTFRFIFFLAFLETGEA